MKLKIKAAIITLLMILPCIGIISLGVIYPIKFIIGLMSLIGITLIYFLYKIVYDILTLPKNNQP